MDHCSTFFCLPSNSQLSSHQINVASSLPPLSSSPSSSPCGSASSSASPPSFQSNLSSPSDSSLLTLSTTSNPPIPSSLTHQYRNNSHSTSPTNPDATKTPSTNASTNSINSLRRLNQASLNHVGSISPMPLSTSSASNVFATDSAAHVGGGHPHGSKPDLSCPSHRNPQGSHSHSLLPSDSESPSLNNRSDGSTPQQSPQSHRLVSRIPSRISTSQPTQVPNTSRSQFNSSPPKPFPSDLPNHPLPSPEVIQAACDELMAQQHCLASATYNLGAKHYAFNLSGSLPNVMAARGRLLREQPFEVEKVVRVQRADVLQGGSNVPPAMKTKLDEIASTSRAHLSIVGHGDGSEGEVDIVVRGDQESVEEARIRLLVLLDQLAGLHLEVCEIDNKLHHIIAGRKRSVIQSIQAETATNIYFPSTLSADGIFKGRHSPPSPSANMIIITGEFFGVQRAREMLFQVSVHKSKCIISRDTDILPRKMDWMLMERLPALERIMYDNGTFIHFPPIGSQASIVSVYGDHHVQIERSIRSLMQLACEFYIADVWLLPHSLHSDYFPTSRSQIAPLSCTVAHDGQRIASESGAEVVFKGTNCFEVFGTDRSVKAAVQEILQLEVARRSRVEVRFQVELACEHRDFISGKKNGKLNKIMKSSNVKIKFESFNAYNFFIDLSGSSTTAIMGLKLLEEELPAEISFHVPEGYHKRIIGVGGKNIQRIMKKHGVYVKFSNAEEFASLGGYVDNHDNVVARTPAKNAANLEYLKQSVMELVHPNDKDFVTEHINIARQHHRNILGEKAIFIHEIESKTNTCFYFPSTESGSDTVAIFGPRSQIAIAKEMMLTHVGLEFDYRLVPTAGLLNFLRSDAFEESVVRRCKQDWNVQVGLVVSTSDGDELTIKFSSGTGRPDHLRHAQATLEASLIEHKVHFQPEPVFNRHSHRRSTVTSIGSFDQSTSAGAFTPTTPTETLGFGLIHHHSSEKDLKGIYERSPVIPHSNRPGQTTPSSTDSSPSPYIYHPTLSSAGIYSPFVSLPRTNLGVGKVGGNATTDSDIAEWNLTSRHAGMLGKPNMVGVGGAFSPTQISPTTTHGPMRDGAGALNSKFLSPMNRLNGPPTELINRKLLRSPKAQSIDLGKSNVGGNMAMINPYALGGSSTSLAGIGGRGVSGSMFNFSLPRVGMAGAGTGAGISESIPQERMGLHRYRFSQGTNPFESHLLNGLKELNLQ